MCAQKTFWSSSNSTCVSCDSKTPHCAACNRKTGVCAACATSYVLDSTTKSCKCRTGQTDFGSFCKTLLGCPAGTYNDGVEKCISCGSNCLTCDNITGNCTNCITGYSVMATDKKSCENPCLYKVGPVES